MRVGAWAFTPAEWDHPRAHHNTQLLPLLKIYRLATPAQAPSPTYLFVVIVVSACPKSINLSKTQNVQHWQCSTSIDPWRIQFFPLFGLSVSSKIFWMFSRALTWFLWACANQSILVAWSIPNGVRHLFPILPLPTFGPRWQPRRLVVIFMKYLRRNNVISFRNPWFSMSDKNEGTPCQFVPIVWVGHKWGRCGQQ